MKLFELKGEFTMTEQDKLAMLEDLLEVEEGTLKPETMLSDVEEYDSMSMLSLIVMMQDEFRVNLKSADVKGFRTVGDILARMEKE